MSADNGGPAFPVLELAQDETYQNIEIQHSGMTLRDYMAIHANDSDVQEVLNSHRTTCDYAGPLLRGEFIVGAKPFTITRQQARYMHAEAMLLERAK